MHDRVIKLPIYLREDPMMETYNDVVTLRYIVESVWQFTGKEVNNIIEHLLPDHYKLRYSDGKLYYTEYYNGNKNW